MHVHEWRGRESQGCKVVGGWGEDEREADAEWKDNEVGALRRVRATSSRVQPYDEALPEASRTYRRH